MNDHYGFCRNIQISYGDAIPIVTQALRREGFGVLSEIDVKAALEQELDADYRPYTILSVCNPHLAHQTLQTRSELGLLLPCNVAIYDTGDGTSTVCVVDPIQTLGAVNDPSLQPIAGELNRRLWRVYLHVVTEAASRSQLVN